MSNFPQVSTAQIEQAGRIIRKGGLVAFPTETVYGLGANGLDATAVAKIFEAKARPAFDPVILHVSATPDLQGLVSHAPDAALQLAGVFWPGPLTLVLSKNPAIPGVVTAGLDTVAVRCPSHPVARELIGAAGVPIAAPSANSFGRLSPTRAFHVRDDLGDAVDLIIDGGDCDWGVESTIVDMTRDTPTVLRYGALAIEELRAVVPDLRVEVVSSSRPSAPGQLESHYAPSTPLTLVEGPVTVPDGAACLAFTSLPDGCKGEVLSTSGSLTEAAGRLFDALHRLDDGSCDAIYAEAVPDEGIGRAINDRLRRAAAR